MALSRQQASQMVRAAARLHRYHAPRQLRGERENRLTTHPTAAAPPPHFARRPRRCSYSCPGRCPSITIAMARSFSLPAPASYRMLRRGGPSHKTMPIWSPPSFPPSSRQADRTLAAGRSACRRARQPDLHLAQQGTRPTTAHRRYNSHALSVPFARRAVSAQPWYCPTPTLDAMNLHLATISQRVAPGAHPSWNSTGPAASARDGCGSPTTSACSTCRHTRRS